MKFEGRDHVLERPNAAVGALLTDPGTQTQHVMEATVVPLFSSQSLSGLGSASCR